MAMFIVIVQEP